MILADLGLGMGLDPNWSRLSVLFGYQDVMRFIGESASAYKKFRKLIGKSVSCWGLYNCMIIIKY